MLRVRLELPDQLVVEMVGGLSPSRTIMIALSVSNSLNTLPTRCIACIDAASFGLIDTVCFADDVQGRDERAEDDDESDPAQDDQRRELVNRPRKNRHVWQPRGLVVGHADFTMQKV